LANFLPLKRHLLRCLGEAVSRFELKPPFLDAGCGIGDVSVWLAQRGWPGLAVDYSAEAVARARENLRAFAHVEVRHAELSDLRRQFGTIILWDVLEHVEDDGAVLRQLAALTVPHGHVVISTPSNPGEWRWDDEFYGHYRRYTAEDLEEKLNAAGWDVEAVWDSTFPHFWILRRIYTRLKPPPDLGGSKEQHTKASSRRNAWDVPILGTILQRSSLLWTPLSALQFLLFRGAVRWGHEVFVVARRRS
jgi:SAM-dependent methyltransferase